jgi:hypothetical protein
MKFRIGSSRCVIVAYKYALKVPVVWSWRRFLYGLLANLQEVRFSRMKTRVLCPVLFYLPGGFLNIMPKCVPVMDNSDDEEFNDALNYIWRMSDEDGVDYRNIVEPKASSLGKLDGRIVAVDYG